MSEDQKKLLGVRRNQLDSMSQMVDSLRDENEKLKGDHKMLSEAFEKMKL